MQDIRMELEKKIKAVDSVINFISVLEQYGIHDKEHYYDKPPTIDMKAAVIVMLYNVVESTMTGILIKIHDYINEHGAYYDILSEKIQKLYIKYYIKSINKNFANGNVDQWHDFIDTVANKRNKNIPTYKEFSKYVDLCNGNLDAREIKQILEKYGVDEIKIEKKGLQYIKDKRNQLAHGEMTFEEIGRDLSVRYLIELKNLIMDFFDVVIQKVEEFLSEKKFLMRTD